MIKLAKAKPACTCCMTLLVKQMTKVSSLKKLKSTLLHKLVSQATLGHHHDTEVLQASTAKHRSFTEINGITQKPYRREWYISNNLAQNALGATLQPNHTCLWVTRKSSHHLPMTV